MRRIIPLSLLAPLALALGACGGGGGDDGDQDAFCDVAEEVNDDDGNPSERQLEELAATAPDEISDAVEVIVAFTQAVEDEDEDALDEFDDQDIEDAGQDIEDFLEDECGIEIEDEGSDEETTTTTEDDDEDTTTTEDEDADDDGDGATGGLPDGESAPDLDDPEEASLAADCENGSMAACDELFFSTAVDSVGEDYGSTCGGRVDIEDEQSGNCAAFFGQEDDVETDDTIVDEGDIELGAASPPPDLDDPQEASLAEACFEGDMGACDELFRVTDVDSPEEAYGETCGGRLSSSEAVPTRCEELFGAQVD